MTTLIIFGAKYLVFAVAAGAAAHLAFVKERGRPLLYVAVVALPLAFVLARLAGMLFSHVQPFAALGFEPLVAHDIDNSFPSDHTLMAGVLSTVVFLSDRRFGLVLWALTLLVGLCRVLAGLHWAVDIVFAALIAMVAVYAVNVVLNYFWQQE